MELAKNVIGRNVKDFRKSFRDGKFDLPPKYFEGDEEWGWNRYLEFPELGVSIVLDESDRATALQLYSVNTDPPEYHEYQGDLIGGLNFTSNKDDVRKILGCPVRESDGGLGTGLKGTIGAPWDLFRTLLWDINITYNGDGDSINFISISIHNDEIALAK